METTPSFIDGAPVTGSDVYPNIDPADGSVCAHTSRGTAEHVDRAVEAAAAAQRQWKKTTPRERSGLLVRTAGLIGEHVDDLARLESADTGKPLSQARADVLTAQRYFEFYGHTIEAFYSSHLPMGEDMHVYTRHEPYGVTGHIVAWNYPLQLISRAVATSLAVGNCVVAKPADETPRSTVALARLVAEAGFPAGAFNVVTGLGPEVGAALAEHPGVAHLGFVGSTATGSRIAHAAAERVIPTVLELGGKSANVVCADADLDRALPAVLRSAVQNAGQTCSAGSRLLVHRSVYSEVLERLAAAMRQLSLGRGLDDPDMGPLISERQRQRVLGFFDRLECGRIVTGGRAPEDPALAGGAFFAPTLVADVDPGSEIAREEVFGPVVAACAFDDDDEAVALANGTDYGLVSAVWTRDLRRAHRMAADIEAGQVFVNNYGAGGGVEFPFGGFGKSGYGREKSMLALEEYTQTKTVIIQL